MIMYVNFYGLIDGRYVMIEFVKFFIDDRVR